MSLSLVIIHSKVPLLKRRGKIINPNISIITFSALKSQPVDPSHEPPIQASRL
jgi:hypothetical protein